MMPAAPALRLAWLLACAVLLGGCATMTSNSTAVAGQRWEAALTSARAYDNPFRDVAVEVVYTGPEGRSFRTSGFWDGGATFRIRAAFPTPGRWSWRTAATDAANAGLHDVTGTVDVAPYTGPNPLYRHGSLRVSANRRHLEHADGTPFLYLADTAWLAPQYATVEDWRDYVDDRAAKHFTVIQIASAADWDRGEADPRNALKADFRNVHGAIPFTLTDGRTPARNSLVQWNPDFWRHVDALVEEANRRGLVVFVNGVMNPAGNATEGAAPAFARALAGRLAGNHVLLAPNFDSNPWRTGEVADFDSVGSVLQEFSPNLVITHPNTAFDPVENAHGYAWLDVSGVQSGHNGGRRDAVFARAREWTRRAYDLTPTKPVINLEALYDASASGSSVGKYTGTAKDARATAYLSVLNGSAGYGYGAFGIWNWEPAPERPYHWRVAMDYASSRQLGHFAQLLRRVSWWRLEPRSEAILNQPGEPTPEWRQKVMAFALADDRRTGVAYLPAGGSIELDLGVFAGPVTQVTWFDPVTGEEVEEPVASPRVGPTVLTAPETLGDDAVLVLRSRAP